MFVNPAAPLCDNNCTRPLATIAAPRISWCASRVQLGHQPPTLAAPNVLPPRPPSSAATSTNHRVCMLCTSQNSDSHRRSEPNSATIQSGCLHASRLKKPNAYNEYSILEAQEGRIENELLYFEATPGQTTKTRHFCFQRESNQYDPPVLFVPCTNIT
jgi:hypothetical protein